ncbi:MAG TPA: EamA family transporter [Candidatus Limnocylindrales bacterium]
MIAILGGLGAAIFFAASTTSSSRSARMIGAPAVVGWMMFVGLLATLPLFPLTGALDVHLTALDVLLLVVTGLTNVFGLVVEYAALRVGRVGLVVGLVSSEGAVAAVINIVGGQSIGLAVALALAVIAGGVVVIGFASEDVDAPSKDPRVATMLALVAAGCFGVNLIAVGRLAADLPLPWALMAPRVAGVVCITIPLLLLGRLSRSRRAAPFVIVSGLSEVAGLAAFAIGSQTDLTVASVLTSQFATITAIAAWVIFRERLSTWQIVGVTAVIGGVAVLALLNV